MGLTAYKRTISNTESPRQIERRILQQATSELEKFQAEFDQAEKRFDRLQMLADGGRNSLWKNQQIWMSLKHDLMESENQLDENLRASLISLAVWVENHTQSVMAGGKEIRPLIDINRSIIDGLSGRALSPAR
ncbi:MAG: flagellar biosynthesis regulator FlaF [Rhodobacteraceae bacterium]|nr:flagellar biosynthesis regulator FlaF [Paracoccaceae bacterium]